MNSELFALPLVYRSTMSVHSLKAIQTIPVSIEKAWDFFSSPNNLQAITPADLNFNIISQHQGNSMYAGQIIEYKVSPLPGIRVYWMTEITHVEANHFFADEQRFGPYSLWHHQHHFKNINDNAVEMTDIVHYKLPLWFLGDVAHSLFIRKRLQQIFAYRFQKTEELFGKWPGQTAAISFY